MKINISGKGMHVSKYLHELTEKKLGKLERYFDPNTEAQATLSVEKTRQICEVTIPIKGGVIRAREVSGDMYASIDGVVDKLEKQIQKHRTKLEKRLHEGAYHGTESIQAEKPREVVRKKSFDLKPMHIDEAILQMELVDHTFYVFRDAFSDEINVLYLREDGDLGLISPSDQAE